MQVKPWPARLAQIALGGFDECCAQLRKGRGLSVAFCWSSTEQVTAEFASAVQH